MRTIDLQLLGEVTITRHVKIRGEANLSFPKTRNAHRTTCLKYPLSRGVPLIMVIEAANLGDREHLATLGRVDRTGCAFIL